MDNATITNLPEASASEADSGFALLCTIKATAMNKQRARVWLERSEAELAPFGFARGERINIDISDFGIIVTASENGARKVAGRPGKCILDICMPQEQRERMRGDAERFDVLIGNGRIVIQQPGV